MSYLEHQFLVAMPGLDDPNFSRGVTLLCQHNDDGALGLTINRPSDIKLSALLEQIINRPSDIKLSALLEQIGFDNHDPSVADQVVFEGGPLHQERGFVLHETIDDDRVWDSSLAVGQDLRITTSKDILAAIAEGNGPERFIVALGYAGWDAGQLEQEIRDNAWLNVDATSEILFNAPVDKRWEQAVASLGFSASALQPSGGHA